MQLARHMIFKFSFTVIVNYFKLIQKAAIKRSKHGFNISPSAIWVITAADELIEGRTDHLFKVCCDSFLGYLVLLWHSLFFGLQKYTFCIFN